MQSLILAQAAWLWIAPALIADDQNDNAAKKELKRWQGTWEVVKATYDGKPLPGPKNNAKSYLVITDNTFIVRHGAIVKERGTMTITDAKSSPKRFDHKVYEENRGDVARLVKRKDPENIVGIYEIRGDELKVCCTLGDVPLPTKFESKSGSRLFLCTYKRVTDKKQKKR